MLQEIREGLVPTPDGARLAVYRLGDGADAVLVPNAVYLLEHFAYLARHFTVISWDLRNRGRSPRVDDPALLHRGIHHDVEDIEAIRDAFALDRVHLIGHSYLGLAVILYAVAHPHRVRRIVQIGAVGPDPDRDYPRDLRANDLDCLLASSEAVELDRLRKEGATEDDPEAFCKAWWRLMRKVFVASEESAEAIGDHFCAFENEWPLYMERHLRDNIWPSIQRLELTAEAIETVRAPVLSVHGRMDRNSPYGAGRDWALRLPDARLLTVPGAAHMPYLEQPGFVQPAIEHFLAGHWPESAEVIEAL